MPFAPPRPAGRGWWAVLAIPSGLAVAVAVSRAVAGRHVHDFPPRGMSLGPLVLATVLLPSVMIGLPFLSGRMFRRASTGYAPPGWRDDPAGIHALRYWDGMAWTGRGADGGVEVLHPIDEAPTVAGGTPRELPARLGVGSRFWWVFVAVPITLMALVVIDDARRGGYVVHPSAISAFIGFLATQAWYIVPSFFGGRFYEERREVKAETIA